MKGELIAVTEIEEIQVGDKLVIYDMEEIHIHEVTLLDGNDVVVDGIYNIEPNSQGQWLIIPNN